jgi:hypothetical protein
MSNLIYFHPTAYKNPKEKRILKLVPRDIREADRADIAERVLSPEDYLIYLSLIVLYGAYDYVSNYHKQIIEELVSGGILDDIAVHSKSGLTDSCVTQDKRFLHNNREFKLPNGYKPILRIVDSNNDIFVEAQNSNGKIKIYQFMYYKSDKKYTWKKIDENDLLVDF